MRYYYMDVIFFSDCLSNSISGFQLFPEFGNNINIQTVYSSWKYSSKYPELEKNVICFEFFSNFWIMKIIILYTIYCILYTFYLGISFISVYRVSIHIFNLESEMYHHVNMFEREMWKILRSHERCSEYMRTAYEVKILFGYEWLL